MVCESGFRLRKMIGGRVRVLRWRGADVEGEKPMTSEREWE
jgi:hypothetical protein